MFNLFLRRNYPWIFHGALKTFTLFKEESAYVAQNLKSILHVRKIENESCPRSLKTRKMGGRSDMRAPRGKQHVYRWADVSVGRLACLQGTGRQLVGWLLLKGMSVASGLATFTNRFKFVIETKSILSLVVL